MQIPIDYNILKWVNFYADLAEKMLKRLWQLHCGPEQFLPEGSLEQLLRACLLPTGPSFSAVGLKE